MKLVILVASLVIATQAELRSERITDTLDDVLKKYDPRVRPNSGVAPTTVTLTGYALQVGGFCGKNDDMKVDMYFRQSWSDPRLVLELKAEDKGDAIQLGHNFNKKLLWTPDTFFVNSRKSDKHDVLNDNFWLRIHADGHVAMSERVQVQAKCGNGRTKWNVGETRTCSVKAASYGYNDNQVNYKWKDDYNFAVEQTLYPYNVTGVTLTYLPSPATFTANYTRAVINFEIVKLAEKIETMDEKRD